MPTKYLRAKANVNLPVDGAMLLVEQGDIVPADSPILKKLTKAGVAEHFSEVVPGGGLENGFSRWDVEKKPEKKVESATAAPGEKRK